MFRSLALLATIAVLGGCALTEDTVDIKYIPTKATMIADAKPVGLSVVDGRTTDRARISAKMNAYGMEMAAIRSKEDVTDVVNAALKTEFEARGFHVESSGRAVTVTVNHFYNQFGTGFFSGTATGDVNLGVTVAGPAGAPLYTGTIDGTSKMSIQMAGGSNAAESLATAIADAVTKLFADPAFVSAVTKGIPATKPVS
ncbi:MAG TPA: YajG family lipoprotein [Alphaproteobacteria bacterium]|jgi:uncharacterized lipoprotein|nr:YajG family lipoprotein [Alphaproteobacteria bacterium]